MQSLWQPDTAKHLSAAHAESAGGFQLSARHAGESAAQTVQSVAGTYSIVTVRAFGDNPRGQLTLGVDGRYSILIARTKLDKIASGARDTATAEENKMVTSGTIAHFGKYTIDDGGKTITFHIETSTFPNWDGTTQKRELKVSGDTLAYVVPAAPIAGSQPSELVWRRLK